MLQFFICKNRQLYSLDNSGILSTVLTEFIRSVPIALTLSDRNEPERNERTKLDSDTEMDNRTTETDLNRPTYTAEG